jgi:REP element-mobilizing transposase RayT
MTAEGSDPASRVRPERLRRLGLIFPRAPVYFVTACTTRRKKILARRDVHEVFQKFARESPKHGAWIGAFVLMPDHLHLFVAFDDELISLSGWMKSLKNAISKTLRLAGIASPHWQKGFFDHLLRSEESYSEKWEYVRNNPLRAGLVACAQEWPYQGEIHRIEVRRS